MNAVKAAVKEERKRNFKFENNDFKRILIDNRSMIVP